MQSELFEGPDPRTDQVRGRLDAVLIAARVAPLTEHVGLVPTITTSHTEPFHISKAIATLDFMSHGRAGVRVQLGGSTSPAEHFGRRTMPKLRVEDLRKPESAPILETRFDEGADYVEVVRRLWDSWEDDAEIRDVTTGRFVDIDKLHYIEFEGRWFSVKGPSITPRPPQGQPLVTSLAHITVAYRLAARGVDVCYVTPRDLAHARDIVAELRLEQEAAGRADEPLLVFADLAVFLDEQPGAAANRKARLDGLAGEPYHKDAREFVGSASELADLLVEWRDAGIAGYRLRPGAIPHDLTAITNSLVPELRRRGIFRTAYEANTLRGLLGLQRPANRYATV
jgi:alkanesulfonate monooxygenase SsuD/methylene tetrahydromethanopterin reductase-like flavin-dependent oxidoreductase (luciferase family)